MTAGDDKLIGRFGLMVRGVVMIASVAAVILIGRAAGLDADLGHIKAWVDANVLGRGAVGCLVFVLVAAVGTGVGLPRQVFSIAAGYAFGTVLGTALVVAGAVIGCVAAFYYARLLGRRAIAQRFPKRIARVDAFLRQSPFLLSVAVRLLPVGSNLATNAIAGVSGIPALAFFAGTAVGYVPQSLVFALVGSGVNQGIVAKSVLAVALFVASATIGLYIYRKHRHGRSLDPALDAAAGDDGGAAEAASGGEARLPSSDPGVH